MGGDQGLFSMPDIDPEVWVESEAGDAECRLSEAC